MTKLSRELVEPREVLCSTTVLVREVVGGVAERDPSRTTMKEWVKGFSLVGTGVWDRPAPGAALYSSGALWGAQEPITTLTWQAALLFSCAHVVLLMVFFCYHYYYYSRVLCS